eukprot:gene25723-biopygen3017
MSDQLVPANRNALPADKWPEIVVGKLDYSPHPPVSFARPERAPCAVRIATRKTEIPWNFAPLGEKSEKRAFRGIGVKAPLKSGRRPPTAISP